MIETRFGGFLFALFSASRTATYAARETFPESSGMSLSGSRFLPFLAAQEKLSRFQRMSCIRSKPVV